jgi:hypothetical protein
VRVASEVSEHILEMAEQVSVQEAPTDDLVQATLGFGLAGPSVRLRSPAVIGQ